MVGRTFRSPPASLRCTERTGSARHDSSTPARTRCGASRAGQYGYVHLQAPSEGSGEWRDYLDRQARQHLAHVRPALLSKLMWRRDDEYLPSRREDAGERALQAYADELLREEFGPHLLHEAVSAHIQVLLEGALGRDLAEGWLAERARLINEVAEGGALALLATGTAQAPR